MNAEGLCLKLCIFAVLICLLLLFPLATHSPVLARQSFHRMNTAGQPQPAIFITDLARYSDDVVALLMLLRSRAFDIKGIVTNARQCLRRGRGAIHARAVAIRRGTANGGDRRTAAIVV
jgi:hypothetical protein